jgi:hypothetical protein
LYEVEITPEGLRHLHRLPEKVRAAALESILDRSPRIRGGSAIRFSENSKGSDLLGEAATASTTRSSRTTTLS